MSAPQLKVTQAKGPYKDIQLLNSQGDQISEAETLAAKLNARKFDPTRKPKAAPLLLSIDGVPIANAGETLLLYGPAKAMKTGVVKGVAAGALGNESALGVRSHLNDLRVAHFDHEQGNYHHWKVAKTILDVSGEPLNTDRFASFCMKGFGFHEQMKMIEGYAAEYRPHLIILDPITGLIPDVNDSVQAKEFVDWIASIQVAYGCAVMPVLHSTPTSPRKPIGHIGTALLRNCQHAMITIRPEIGGEHAPYSIVSTTEGRDGEFESFAIAYDKKAGTHVRWGRDVEYKVTGDKGKPEHMKAFEIDPHEYDNEFHAWIAEQVLAGVEEMKPEDYQAKIKRYGPNGRVLQNFNQWYQHQLTQRIIVQTGAGLVRLSDVPTVQGELL